MLACKHGHTWHCTQGLKLRRRWHPLPPRPPPLTGSPQDTLPCTLEQMSLAWDATRGGRRRVSQAGHNYLSELRPCERMLCGIALVTRLRCHAHLHPCAAFKAGHDSHGLRSKTHVHPIQDSCPQRPSPASSRRSRDARGTGAPLPETFHAKNCQKYVKRGSRVCRTRHLLFVCSILCSILSKGVYFGDTGLTDGRGTDGHTDARCFRTPKRGSSARHTRNT